MVPPPPLSTLSYPRSRSSILPTLLFSITFLCSCSYSVTLFLLILNVPYYIHSFLALYIFLSLSIERYPCFSQSCMAYIISSVVVSCDDVAE
ncbi:uncharacterized protein BJ212DRAFT_216738 [Suillus subaureus]|uniref:Uncharacterized protein n=1 Tax=Suillus subaureus TaxID=48587 RepID=A0A9P7DMD4_9AGAM|nr:uncharacterized protein BJ212DRAFT_216738 [Suillus subaureus]KAG1798383.1 hypothetical protein BJ212DRAFT_216738 [Suillus subaureus]